MCSQWPKMIPVCYGVTSVDVPHNVSYRLWWSQSHGVKRKRHRDTKIDFFKVFLKTTDREEITRAIADCSRHRYVCSVSRAASNPKWELRAPRERWWWHFSQELLTRMGCGWQVSMFTSAGVSATLNIDVIMSTLLIRHILSLT